MADKAKNAGRSHGVGDVGSKQKRKQERRRKARHRAKRNWRKVWKQVKKGFMRTVLKSARKVGQGVALVLVGIVLTGGLWLLATLGVPIDAAMGAIPALR